MSNFFDNHDQAEILAQQAHLDDEQKLEAELVAEAAPALGQLANNESLKDWLDEQDQLANDPVAKALDIRYPRSYIGSTQEALWDHYSKPQPGQGHRIFIADLEQVVGVSVGAHIIAVTENNGAFAAPPNTQAVDQTIRNLGLDPNAIVHAIERAELRGFETNPAITNNPQIAEAQELLRPHEATKWWQYGPQPEPTPIDTDNTEIVYRYDPNLETFQATIWYGDQHTEIGTTIGEHLTVESLHSAVTNDPDHRIPTELRALAEQVRIDPGDYTIVGLKDEGDPRLFVVTPEHRITELLGDAEYSPNGFNWGYDGSGPAQVAKSIIEVSRGEAAAENVGLVRALAKDLGPHLPDNFTINGSDLSAALNGTPGRALLVINQPAQQAISNVREYLADAPDIDLTKTGVDLTDPSPDLDTGASL